MISTNMFGSENHYQKKIRKLLLMIIISKKIGIKLITNYLSIHIAIPIPPPIQSVAKPLLTSLFIIS